MVGMGGWVEELDESRVIYTLAPGANNCNKRPAGFNRKSFKIFSLIYMYNAHILHEACLYKYRVNNVLK